MQLSFGSMNMELNIFNIVKQPHYADAGIIDVDLIEEIVDNIFLSDLSDDTLQTCLTHFGLDFDIYRSVDNELIPTRVTTGWCVCIDYRKLNYITRKDHFPLPFIDQMLDRLAGQEFHCTKRSREYHFHLPFCYFWI